MKFLMQFYAEHHFASLHALFLSSVIQSEIEHNAIYPAESIRHSFFCSKTFLIGNCRIENHHKTRVWVHFANAEWTLFVRLHFEVAMGQHPNNSLTASSNIMSKITKLIFKLNSRVLCAIWHFAEMNPGTFFLRGRSSLHRLSSRYWKFCGRNRLPRAIIALILPVWAWGMRCMFDVRVKFNS